MNGSADQLRCRATLELCAQGVSVGGQTFTANANTAFIVARFSHALPAATVNGGALHPATIANSWTSIIQAHFNWMHTADTLGTVMAAEFPAAPAGGWTIGEDPAAAPAIRACCALHRRAKYAAQILELVADGLEWEVSMEVEHRVEQGAFAVRRPEGWEFIPWSAAAPELRALWVTQPGRNGRLAGNWEDCLTRFLWGGVGGRVHYGGLALVDEGAEVTNRVERVLARGETPAGLAAALAEFTRAARTLAGG